VTVLVASHAIDLISRFNKRIITLQNGRLMRPEADEQPRTAGAL